jgi:peptidoglycan hydrolase-like protein with peptidoglycan-binding domain
MNCTRNSLMTHTVTVAVAVVAWMLTPLQLAGPTGQKAGAASSTDALQLQVALDRAGFSPGEIDGRSGQNTERALAAFRKARALPAGTAFDDEVRAALGEHLVEPLVQYTVTEADLEGPFADRRSRTRRPGNCWASDFTPVPDCCRR